MNKTLTALYDSFYTPPQAADTRTEIEVLHKQLILKLDKPERKMVLRLIDAKDRLAEELSMDSFICGFRLAWRLANELSNYPESGRPTRSNQTGQDARVVPQERGIFRTRVSPCWPLCGRLWALLKRTGGWAQRAQPYIPLRQKFRQHPISADTEAIAPLDDFFWNLAEILPSEIGVPKPAVEVRHRQHHPLTVFRLVGGIIGNKRLDYLGG